MVLSKRLNILKNFVSKDLDCADIGADHGLLIISLGNQYFKNKYLGIENKIGPFNNLNNNILKLSKNNNVSCKLSDGLKDVSSNFKSIVLAGMGSELIIKIIKESLNKIININEFIIDAHNNVFKILSFMDEIDFSLDKIEFIKEKEIGYFLFKFTKNIFCKKTNNLSQFVMFCKNNKEVFLYFMQKNDNKLSYYLKHNNIILDEYLIFNRIIERNSYESD